MKNLNEELSNMVEWNRAIIFDQTLKVKARKNIETNEAELAFPKQQLRQKLQRPRHEHRPGIHFGRSPFRGAPLPSAAYLRPQV